MRQSSLKTYRNDLREPPTEQLPDFPEASPANQRPTRQIIDVADLARPRSKAAAAIAGFAALASVGCGIALNHPTIGVVLSTLTILGSAAVAWGNEVIDNIWL